MKPTLTLALLALCGSATAQQFVHQPGAVPGPVLWSEVAVVYDVQNDGLWDVLFVNAQGYEKPGDFGAPSSDPLPPTLLIHGGVTAGMPNFADRSSQYFPASLAMHGKNAAACDLDGDGRTDLAFAVAFGSRQRLFLKDPAAERYLDRSSRLPLAPMNGFGVGWGDLDDDGDLDLVYADAGPFSFSPPGAKARLLLNDGQAFFSEAPAQLGAIEKVGAQNAKIVDIDGDLDLDVIVDGKSPVTQVYLNDGAASFTLTTAAVTAGAPLAYGAYETEWADLDGDLDLDGMLMNFGEPFVDASLQSLLSETGELELRASTAPLAGNNDDDENDFAFFDADSDGDLDVIVSTLLGSFAGEKLFVNQGSFGVGSLALAPAAFTPIDNSTLDLDLCDFDGDGRYDAITAEGEIPIVSFENLYYKNTGPVDTRAPRIGRVSDLGATLSVEELFAGRPVRAWIEDAVVDDGSTYVEADLHWTLLAGGATTVGQRSMPHVGGNLHRALLELPAPPVGGAVGGMLDYHVEARDPVGNVAASPVASLVVCGSELFGAGTGLALSAPASAATGGVLSYQVQAGPAGGQGFLIVGAASVSLPFAGGTLLVQPATAKRVPFLFDAAGAATVDFLVGAAPAGQTLFAQVLGQTPAGPQPFVLSAGVRSVVCAR